MLRAVVDVNVFVSALMTVDGTPSLVLSAAQDRAFRVVVSPELVAELDRVLHSPKLLGRIGPETADALVLDLRRTSEVQYPSPVAVAITRDSADDYLVQLARHARADVLVTGDRDLLDAGLPDVEVLTPRQFLDQLRLGRGAK